MHDHLVKLVEGATVLDPDPEYCLNKIIYCPATMHVGVCDIN